MGPLATWMDSVKGYVAPDGTPTDIVGGPMNIGEEYRWNVPIVTYGFTPAFQEYFGSNGVWAVEQAIKILNDLPPASQINISKYPLNTSRVNYQASGLMLSDLKSTVLSYLLRELGLASPELWAWSVRDHYDINNVPYFYVVQRNYAPITNSLGQVIACEPSSYINGILYTYSLFHATTPNHLAFAIPTPVDPLAPPSPTVVSGDYATYGRFYTGLDRDSVASLAYLYRASLLHVENLSTNVAGSLGGVTFGSQTAWTVVDTNTVLSPGNSPWGAVNVTNAAAATNITGGAVGGPVAGGATNTAVSTALRGGVEKIVFQRVNYDNTLGTWVNITNQITDNFFTNGVIAHQNLQRVLSAPEIVFDARDLGFNAAGGADTPIVRLITQATGWSNNGTLTGTGSAMDGPGVIQPSMTIALTKVGRLYYNVDVGTEATATPFFAWGSFDGSTNAPIVYPVGTSISDLERQILGY